MWLKLELVCSKCCSEPYSVARSLCESLCRCLSVIIFKGRTRADTGQKQAYRIVVKLKVQAMVSTGCKIGIGDD